MAGIDCHCAVTARDSHTDLGVIYAVHTSFVIKAAAGVCGIGLLSCVNPPPPCPSVPLCTLIPSLLRHRR